MTNCCPIAQNAHDSNAAPAPARPWRWRVVFDVAMRPFYEQHGFDAGQALVLSHLNAAASHAIDRLAKRSPPSGTLAAVRWFPMWAEGEWAPDIWPNDPNVGGVAAPARAMLILRVPDGETLASVREHLRAPDLCLWLGDTCEPPDSPMNVALAIDASRQAEENARTGAEATVPTAGVLPAAKPKRTAKPKDLDTERCNAVADVAVRAITQLATWWPEPAYPILRPLTIYALYLEFARAYGMRAVEMELVFAPYVGAGVIGFLEIIRSLPYAEFTPDHFGAAHEMLSGYGLVGRKVVATDGRRMGGVHFTPRALTVPIVQKTLEPLLRIVPPERTLELRCGDPAVGAGAFLLELVRQLGERVLGAGLASDIGEAKRLVAIHCAYGVDICRFAVMACKLALTLECRADAMPHDWLGDNIKHGDALVGLDRGQMARGHWSPDGKDKKGNALPEHPEIAATVDRAIALGVEARKARMAELAEMACGGDS